MLFQAIEDGHLAVVRQALDSAPDVATLLLTTSEAGLTPLASAILQGHVDISSYLLEAGADTQVGYKAENVLGAQSDLYPGLIEQSPPLHCAAIKGSTELVKLLVSHGVDVNSDNAIDRGSAVVPLHVAKGEAIDALIAAHADVDRENEFGWTPLIYSISRKDTDAVRRLVKHGAKVDTARTTRYKVRVASGEEKLAVGTSSPMMVACGHGRLTDQSASIIEILAAAGADVNRRYTVKLGPEDGIPPTFTLLTLICGTKSDKPEVRSPHAAAEDQKLDENYLQVVKLLLHLGADRKGLTDEMIGFAPASK